MALHRGFYWDISKDACCPVGNRRLCVAYRLISGFSSLAWLSSGSTWERKAST